jgi:chaperonin GroEL
MSTEEPAQRSVHGPASNSSPNKEFVILEKIVGGIDILVESSKRNLGVASWKVTPSDSRVGKTNPVKASDAALVDESEAAAAQALFKVATEINELVGDGATTTIVLAQSILRNSATALNKGSDPVQLRLGIDKGLKAAGEYLRKQSRSVTELHALDFSRLPHRASGK